MMVCRRAKGQSAHGRIRALCRAKFVEGFKFQTNTMSQTEDIPQL